MFPPVRNILKPWIGTIVLLALVAASVAAVPSLTGLARVQPEDYLGHVQFLASGEMQGRGAGMPELNLAAHYIAGQFEKFGLDPGGPDNTYLQPFTVTTGAELGEDNHFAVKGTASEQKLEPEQDYIPLNFSSSGSVSGSVVFSGYGVSADEFGYDDYVHLDVKDKIVLLLRYEPQDLGKEQGLGEQRRTYHSHLISKAINARDRGAKAVLMVNGQLEGEEEDRLLKFGSVAGPDDAGILMIHLRNAVAEQWLEKAGKSLSELQAAINEQMTPQSFALPESLEVSIEVDIEREQAQVNNVAGYLPGRSEEYLVIGAHYDHLGLGDQSSLAPSKIGEVHHGADDNASGTAGLIELARIFSERQEAPERGILFLAFAGEEIGLLGSSQWVNHPTLPLDKAVAMINMDMIGRVNESKVYVGGVGTGSNFERLVKEVVEGYDFKFDYSKGGYSASDHTSFVGKQIPVLFFFSGLHSDYHKPSDTWDKINSEAAARVVNMIGDVAARLANGEERSKFTKVEGSPRAAGRRSGGGGYGPYFGSVPDFGQIENGVKFADIRPGSPAEDAGLRAGDILIQFNEKPIKNLYDFTFALRASEVGDVVDVKVLRDGETISAQVKLEQRR